MTDESDRNGSNDNNLTVSNVPLAQDEAKSEGKKESNARHVLQNGNKAIEIKSAIPRER